MGKNRPQLQDGGAIRTFRSSLGIWKKKKTWRNAYYNSLKAGLQRGGGSLRQKGAGVIDWYKKRQTYKKIRARGKDPTKSKVKYRHIVYDDSAITGTSWYDYPPLDPAEDTVRREYIGPTAKETQRVIEDMHNQDWHKKWKASLKEPFKPHR